MDYIRRIKNKFVRLVNRIGLKNKDFTIISNNCWGGFVYQKFGLKYRTPFIGLFLFAPDYIKLLENFNELIFTDIKFIEFKESKYIDYIKKEDKDYSYPIGIIGDDIEIHFLHYKSNEEAYQKWIKRVNRINLDNIVFKFSDRDLCCYELIERFNNLSLKNKLCFTAKEYLNLKSCITIYECEHLKCVESEWIYYENYIDIKRYLNNLYKKYK